MDHQRPNQKRLSNSETHRTSVLIPTQKPSPTELQTKIMPGVELVYTLRTQTFTYHGHRELLGIIDAHPYRFETIPIPQWTRVMKDTTIIFRRRDGGVSYHRVVIMLPLKVVCRKALQKEIYGRLWVKEC